MNFPKSTTNAVANEAALLNWLGAATPGDRLTYYRGFLALDTTAAAQRLPERERVGLIGLARRARWAADAGLVHLVQHRNGPNDYNYLLCARPRLEAARETIAAIFAEVDA